MEDGECRQSLENEGSHRMGAYTWKCQGNILQNLERLTQDTHPLRLCPLRAWEHPLPDSSEHT